MDDHDMMATGDYLGAIAQIVEKQATLRSVVEELRLARVKLGAILDRLEAIPLTADDLEGIRGQSDCVAFEVDGLTVLVREALDR